MCKAGIRETEENLPSSLLASMTRAQMAKQPLSRMLLLSKVLPLPSLQNILVYYLRWQLALLYFMGLVQLTDYIFILPCS